MHPHRECKVTSRKGLALTVLAMAILLGAQTGYAQEGEPSLSFGLSKVFGYAMGSNIQGTFNVSVDGDGDFAQIKLLIDGLEAGSDDTPPFRIQFSTSDFPPGVHAISVSGITTEGDEITSSDMPLTFLSSEEARTQTVGVVVPLLAVVLAVMVLGSVLPAVLGRGKRRFQAGNYGPSGGTVCPRCKLPFRRSVLSFNLLVGKLERCPHCGKWGVLPRASSSDLEAAEKRYAATLSEGVIQQDDEQDQLRRMIDESRFENND
jgi:hypothetical protein